MNTIDNARAIEAALQVLQGPPSSGKLLVKSLADDGAVLQPGTCAYPIDGNATDLRAGVYVKRNPATAPAPGEKETALTSTWPLTTAGVLVDVESIQGGAHANRPGGTSYRWDPPLDGVELRSVADVGGLTGGANTGAFAALRQFAHIKTLNFPTAPGQNLFAMNISVYPAAVLAWASMVPLDGPLSAAPGPRSARTGNASMLYRHSWELYLVTSKLESATARSLEGQTLLADVMAELTEACRVRDRCFVVSGEPGAQIQGARPVVAAPGQFVDMVTFDTTFTLTRESRRSYHDWLRTRLRQQIPAGENDAPIDLPNVVVPMPPNGPGTPPFP